MVQDLDALLGVIEREARREQFPIDEEVYREAGKDPLRPILCAGSLEAPVCVLGRDLGADEVALGEPLVGAAGRLLRSGIYQTYRGRPPERENRRLAEALDHVLLTNTVPYKPPGNKAYAAKVRERFRAFVTELLVGHWSGRHVITLGNEAFQWFSCHAPAEAEALWARPDRYESELVCVLTVPQPAAEPLRKELVVLPLPHPSPLNQRWYKQFPGLLARRLETVQAVSAQAAQGRQVPPARG